MKRIVILLILTLPVIFFTLQPCIASDDTTHDVKTLKEAGKIMSLEIILDKLSAYDIKRLLEVELEHKKNQYIYEIEYINSKGIIYEIEVDAVTAKVLKTEREY